MTVCTFVGCKTAARQLMGKIVMGASWQKCSSWHQRCQSAWSKQYCWQQSSCCTKLHLHTRNFSKMHHGNRH